MLPALLIHVGRIHDGCTEIFRRTRRGTFHFKGPWFSNMEILGTVNPANVHYILSSNFKNFPKGPGFRQIFDVLGDGIFNSDSDSWRQQRRVARALINHRGLHRYLVRISRDKVEHGLVPVLEMVCGENRVVDFQDVFQRFTFDTTCRLVTGYDPGCLSVDLPRVPFSRAMDDVEEAIFVRHVLPEGVWKLLRWVGVGSERKMREGWEILDGVIGGYIAKKRDELMSGNVGGEALDDLDGDGDGVDLLTSYIKGGGDHEGHDHDLINCDDDKFLRDTILNLMIAGRDTTSSALTWFIWLVSTHPEVEEKIREELKLIISPSEEEGDRPRLFKVVYYYKILKINYFFVTMLSVQLNHWYCLFL